MNSGMPNLSKILSQLPKLQGFWGRIASIILAWVLKKLSVKALILGDEAHSSAIVQNEIGDWILVNDAGWAKADANPNLTKEEMDAIDQPVVDALVVLGKYKLRKPSKDT